MNNKIGLKTILIALVLMSISMISNAQELKMLEFRADMSMTDAVQFPKEDLNGDRCGLIRLGLVIPDAIFEGDIISSEYKDGEWWIYMPKGSNWLTIKSKRHVPLRCEFEKIQSNVTYIMVVVESTGSGGKPMPTQQYLVFQLSPTNAVLEVDGQLWEVDPNGTAMKFVNFGTYSYRVQAPNHIPETGMVTVNDPNDAKTVNVKLKSDFVRVTLKVDADAEIWVNNEKKGTRTWTGPLGKGTYKIECKQNGHETTMISKEITAEMNGQTITLPAPTPIYGSLNVESMPIGATIYIDGKEVGKTPKPINEILVGQHEVRLAKDGYFAYKETVVVNKGERTQVKASLNEMVVVPSTTAQKTSKQYVRKPFVIANVAYSVAPQLSYGLTVGSVEKLGWFLNVTTNFVVLGSNYECDDSGEISEMYSDGYTDYTYTDQIKKSRLSCTAGMVVRLADPISVYFGGGVGYRRLFWMLEDGTRVKNTNHSYGGFSFDGGLLFHFKVVSFSVGVQTLEFNYAEAKAGIGFTF